VRITWGKIELEPVSMGARRRSVRLTVARTRKFLGHAALHKLKDRQPCDGVLRLLSDDEGASASNAESAKELDESEEYLDLEPSTKVCIRRTD
jgi:hypothetical protein